MSMVVVDDSSLQADSQSKSGIAWSEGRRPLGAALHSPDEPSELLQWPNGHEDNTINIVLVIIIIIIITCRWQHDTMRCDYFGVRSKADEKPT